MNPAWETSPKQSDPGHTKPIPLKKKKNRKNSTSRIHKSSKESQKSGLQIIHFPQGTVRTQTPNILTWGRIARPENENAQEPESRESRPSIRRRRKASVFPGPAARKRLLWLVLLSPCFPPRSSHSSSTAHQPLWGLALASCPMFWGQFFFLWPQPLEVLMFRLGFHLSSISLNLAQYPFCVRAPW